MTSDDQATKPITAGSPGPPRPPDQGRFTPGAVLAGRYRIVGLLGSGGMGEVYRADDLRLRQVVALKFLPPHLADDSRLLERLSNEVRVARQVTHLNVCRVHDIVEVDGQQCISMEHVDGEDLASLLRRIGRFQSDKAVEIARHICAGLAAVHDQGILHRDLKPANIMIDGMGRARLTDFGLAMLSHEDAGEEIAGTPAYMAPEQADGTALSRQSDLYALGLVLYEIFVGRPAFPVRDRNELPRPRRKETPSRPSQVAPDIDPAVERIILRCLEVDPSLRPSSALSVAAALPGTDALAAMLAAGETPPPELVAAAGERGALRPAAAWTCLGFVMIAAPIVLLLQSPWLLFTQVPLDKPPAVLAEHAREYLRMAGFDPDGRSTIQQLYYAPAVVDYLSRDPSRWEDVARAAPIRYELRVGVGRGATGTRTGPWGLTGASDSPDHGVARVELDTHGSLIRLMINPAVGTPLAASPGFDWTKLLEAGGADFEKLETAAPEAVPPVFAATRVAWRGTHPAAPEVRIEGAAFRGRPVFLEFLGPWDRIEAHGFTSGFDNLWRLSAPLFFVFLAAAVIFASRNLRLGRGDRRGAGRLARFTLVVATAAWAIGEARIWWSPLQQWRHIGRGLGQALWVAALFWLLYLAIEPALRRRWPETLISWSRLLAGRYRDPRVGRDLLLGMVVAWGNALLACGGKWLESWSGGTAARPEPVELGCLLGFRPALAACLGGIATAIAVALFAGLLLVLLRMLLRGHRVTIAAYFLLSWAIVAASFGSSHPTALLTQGLMVAAILILLLRVGLLATIVPFYIGFLEIPWTPDVTRWYGQPTAIALALIASVAAYGFWTSLGGRSPFGDGSFE